MIIGVSSQLENLQDSGGGPWRPRWQDEPPTELVGCGGTEGGGEVETGQDQHPWGVAERGEGFPLLWTPLGSGIGGSMARTSPAQLAREVRSALGLGLMPSMVPSGLRRSCGHRREAGEIGRGRQGGPSRTRGAGEEQRAFVLHTQAWETCWAPRLVLSLPNPLQASWVLGT